MNFRDEKFWKWLLIAWIIILGVLYSTLSIIRHNHFQSGGFDLGIYDQALWQYSKFIIPYNTVKERFILGDHLTLTLPFLSPLYWIWDNVRIILIFQAFWLSFSALAVYKIARIRLLRPETSFIVSVIYSLFYGIQYAVFFDFHPVSIGVGLLIWTAYFLESKKQLLCLLSILLLLFTQENMGLALAGLGFIYIFNKYFRKTAAIFILVGLTYSFIAVKIIAFFSSVGFEYSPEILLNPITLFQRYFDNSEKRLVFFYTLSGFSFLPLGSPGAILAVLSDLGQYFLGGEKFVQMWTPFKHHRAILAVFLALGSIEILFKFKQRKLFLQLITIIMLTSTLFQQYVFHFPLNKLSKKIYWQNESWMDDNRKLIKLIPANASLVTQQSLVPHLTHRNQIYLAWPRQREFTNSSCGQPICWWLDFVGSPQYLVVDLHPNQWLTQMLESNENFNNAVTNMIKAKRLSLVNQVNNAKLYKINYP